MRQCTNEWHTHNVFQEDIFLLPSSRTGCLNSEFIAVKNIVAHTHSLLIFKTWLTT